MAKIREILVIPHSHHDIGYTHVPDVCIDSHEQGIYRAMALCEADADDQSPTSFRWTVEISRSLLRFLQHAAPADVERLKSLVERGRISLTAGYMHMTQLIGTEEYARFFMPVRELRGRYGLPVSVVQHGDINGVGWGSVPLMAEAGLDCLVMALNPDHGRPPFEQPSAFWWEGPDGSRILAWLSIHYGLGGYHWGLHDGSIDQAIGPVTAAVARLEQRDDYPFDFFVIHTAFDNMMPHKRVSDSVGLWNRLGHQPPMRVATMDMAMGRARVQAAAASLPTYRGEWADWWAHGHGSTAYEVGISRRARADLRLAEFNRTLSERVFDASKAAPADDFLPHVNWYGDETPLKSPLAWQERIDTAYDQLLLFEEHTWGAFESVSRPFSAFTQAHWNQKAAFAYDAESQAHALSSESLSALVATLPHADDLALVVVNPIAQIRSELITLTGQWSERTIFVPDLPPLGVKVVPLPAQEAARTTEHGNVLENAYFRLEADPESGSIAHLVDKQSGREWVSAAALTGLGGVVYEQTDPIDPHPAIQTNRRHFHPDTPGPAFVRTAAVGCGAPSVERTDYGATLTLHSAAPYLPQIETKITLYDAARWIDVTVTLTKDDNYGMEGVYVVFPFALQGPTFQLESANAVYQPEVEQLPDTCRDWYSIQHGLGVSDGQDSVLWATREAPLVQLGRLRTGEWARTLDAADGHVYAWLMNNLYFTNFKAAQNGKLTFHFRFSPQSGPISSADVLRYGDAFGTPPQARTAPVQVGVYDWLDVSPESVLVEIVKPSLDRPNALILRLKETGGQAADATIRWKGPSAVRIAQTDFLENAPRRELHGDGHTFKVELKSNALVTLEVMPEA